MRAAVCPVYGPPDVVRIEDQPSAAVAAGQVRVKVGAAAVNFPDVLLIANEYQISVPPPFVPGSEFAGVIVETGDGAGGFAVGNRITGTELYGAFAEEVVVPTAGLSRIPGGVDDRTAAAFGVAYRTAYHTLRSMARVQEGDEVIVQAQAEAWAWRQCSSACSSAPRSRQSRHRPKSSMWQRVTAPNTSSTTRQVTYDAR